MRPKFIKEYLECDAFCPFCNSTDISLGHMEAEVGIAWGECTCRTCGKEWQDEYKLETVSWLENGDRVYADEETEKRKEILFRIF